MAVSINAPGFLVAFALGMLYVYLSRPKPQVVIKFPSPYNAGFVYQESNGDGCFRYKATRVACADAAEPQPIMEPFRATGSARSEVGSFAASPAPYGRSAVSLYSEPAAYF
jgi:hypothetical protein